MENNIFLTTLFSFTTIAVEITLLCCRSQARTVPNNYILLGIFTIGEAYLVSFISSIYDPKIVLTAAFMTTGVVSAVTFYAYKTERDFTIWGGLLSAFVMCIIMFMLFAMIFRTDFLNLFFCILSVLIFTLYLIIDTQMIMGDKKYELSGEDYILGALILYMDIVMIFIYILRILGEKKN
jgi:FtsH-binding integral membrane protein